MGLGAYSDVGPELHGRPPFGLAGFTAQGIDLPAKRAKAKKAARRVPAFAGIAALAVADAPNSTPGRRSSLTVEDEQGNPIQDSGPGAL